MSLFIKFQGRTSFAEFLKMTEQMASALPADVPPHYMSASPLKYRKRSLVALAERGDESIPLHSFPDAYSRLSGLGSVLQELIKSLPGTYAHTHTLPTSPFQAV